MPAGSTLKTIGHYDKSINNRYNPGPDREAQWGGQSWDEMFVVLTNDTVDKGALRPAGKSESQDLRGRQR